MKKTAVCIFCECWESGGIESFLFNVLNNMDLTGLEIDIVVSQFKAGVFSEKTARLGVNFIELSGNQRKSLINYRMFGKILKERKYDVIHLNTFHAFSFIYGVIARKNGVTERIVHSHNTALRKTTAKRTKLLIHNVCKRLFCGAFTELWACSSQAARFMFPKKIALHNEYTLIPNGIDAKRFAFDPKKRADFREKLKAGDKLLIVNIGRLSEQKNQSFLLDAACALKKRKEDFILLLVGEGDMLDELKAKAKRLGVADRVIFYGTTSDIPSVLSAADVFAFPSLFEGLGIAAVEAQAAALPVVCSENIPEEAFLTEYITTVPLDIDRWAETLCEKARTVRSTNTVSRIEEKGYGIKSVSRMIENAYRGLK